MLENGEVEISSMEVFNAESLVNFLAINRQLFVQSRLSLLDVERLYETENLLGFLFTSLQLRLQLFLLGQLLFLVGLVLCGELTLFFCEFHFD